jgi:hypothetical protein
MHSERAHGKRSRPVGNKFIAKVKDAFAALNKPIDWESSQKSARGDEQCTAAEGR